MHYDDRMSDFDRIMWVIEKNPLLRSTITAITVLDRTPNRARVMRRVDRATRTIPRLRQRVVWNPYSIAPPRWEFDPNFDLAYHVRFASAGGYNTFEDVIAQGDRVVWRWTMRGTDTGGFMGRPPTGTAVEVAGVNIQRLDGGQIVEHWSFPDLLGMLRQLGVVPAVGQRE